MDHADCTPERHCGCLRPMMIDRRALLGDKYDDVIEKAAVYVALCRHPVERTPKRLVRLAAALHMTGEGTRIEREVEAALAAVLPDLLAEAWDSGYTRGFYDREQLSPDMPGRDASEGATPNPYRRGTEGESDRG